MSPSTPINKAVDEIRSRAGKKTIVFVSGNFNILHPGHMRFLSFAKERGDFLVVAVNDDSVSGVLFPQDERIQGVRALTQVDYVFGLSSPAEEFLGKLRPQVVVKGKEHEGRINVEKPIVDSYGGKLIFSSGDSKFTSLDLLHKEFQSNRSTLQIPKDFLDRHEITNSKLIDGIRGLKGLKVLVIGDTIVDDYITCEALGLSQEDPTIVVSPLMNKRFIGGAGIVASHAVGLGAETRFYSVVGNDPVGDFALNQLSQYRVEAKLFKDDERPTTLKQRFRTQEKTLLRVNHLSQRSISQDLIEKMLKEIKPSITWSDLIIFSDFSYGCLPQKLVDAVSEEAARQKKWLVADSQSSSQIGDICRFKNAHLLTPTEREARLGLHDFDSGLVVLAENLLAKTQAKNIFVTLGAEGLLVHSKNESEFHTDRLQALNLAPRDTAGAGDSLLVSSSMALASGQDIWMSAVIGSLAAGCQVGRVGNIPLTTEEILREVQN